MAGQIPKKTQGLDKMESRDTARGHVRQRKLLKILGAFTDDADLPLQSDTGGGIDPFLNGGDHLQYLGGGGIAAVDDKPGMLLGNLGVPHGKALEAGCLDERSGILPRRTLANSRGCLALRRALYSCICLRAAFVSPREREKCASRMI